MTRRDIPLDAGVILSRLAEHDVDYVVIGGLAVQAHGHPRTTQDLDIMPGPGAANRRRLEAALMSLGARPVGGEEPQSLKLPRDAVSELDTDAGGVDVHPHPQGAAPYHELHARSLELQLSGPVRVAGLDDLIAMKRASDRPIDRSDVLALTEPAGA